MDKNPFSYTPVAFFDSDICSASSNFLDFPVHVRAGMTAISLSRSVYDLFIAKHIDDVDRVIWQELKNAEVPDYLIPKVRNSIICGLIQRKKGQENPLFY